MDNVLGDELAHMLERCPTHARRVPRPALRNAFRTHRLSQSSARLIRTLYLTEQQTTPFFGAVRALTLMGFFAMSSYGGNKDNVGWKLIDFEGHGATQPPFGYYDAEYMKEQEDGR